MGMVIGEPLRGTLVNRFLGFARNDGVVSKDAYNILSVTLSSRARRGIY
jgi:hypothetical protein